MGKVVLAFLLCAACLCGCRKSEKKLKIGIIGCGGIANGKHMPSLSKVEGVEMVAFCDIDEEKAKAYAEKQKR